MNYQLFSDDVIAAWKQFDLTSKLFVAKCYEEEEIKNGKDFKRVRKVQANSNPDGAMQEQSDI